MSKFVFEYSHFPFKSLKIGDIIAFRTNGMTESGQHEIILHRVAQIVTIATVKALSGLKGTLTMTQSHP
jgi:hypothetical protein